MKKIFLLLLACLLFTGSAFAGSITVSWESPTTYVNGTSFDPDDPQALAGFKVYYGTKVGVYPNIIDVGRINSHTLVGLVDGTYYLVVTAYNDYGESDFSNEVAKTILPKDCGEPCADKRPSPVTNVTIEITVLDGDVTVNIIRTP